MVNSVDFAHNLTDISILVILAKSEAKSYKGSYMKGSTVQIKGNPKPLNPACRAVLSRRSHAFGVVKAGTDEPLNP